MTFELRTYYVEIEGSETENASYVGNTIKLIRHVVVSMATMTPKKLSTRTLVFANQLAFNFSIEYGTVDEGN